MSDAQRQRETKMKHEELLIQAKERSARMKQLHAAREALLATSIKSEMTRLAIKAEAFTVAELREQLAIGDQSSHVAGYHISKLPSKPKRSDYVQTWTERVAYGKFKKERQELNSARPDGNIERSIDMVTQLFTVIPETAKRLQTPWTFPSSFEIAAVAGAMQAHHEAHCWRQVLNLWVMDYRRVFEHCVLKVVDYHVDRLSVSNGFGSSGHDIHHQAEHAGIVKFLNSTSYYLTMVVKSELADVEGWES